MNLSSKLMNITFNTAKIQFYLDISKSFPGFKQN